MAPVGPVLPACVLANQLVMGYPAQMAVKDLLSGQGQEVTPPLSVDEQRLVAVSEAVLVFGQRRQLSFSRCVWPPVSLFPTRPCLEAIVRHLGALTDAGGERQEKLSPAQGALPGQLGMGLPLMRLPQRKE